MNIRECSARAREAEQIRRRSEHPVAWSTSADAQHGRRHGHVRAAAPCKKNPTPRSRCGACSSRTRESTAVGRPWRQKQRPRRGRDPDRCRREVKCAAERVADSFLPVVVLCPSPRPKNDMAHSPRALVLRGLKEKQRRIGPALVLVAVRVQRRRSAHLAVSKEQRGKANGTLMRRQQIE